MSEPGQFICTQLPWLGFLATSLFGAGYMAWLGGWWGMFGMATVALDFIGVYFIIGAALYRGQTEGMQFARTGRVIAP